MRLVLGIILLSSFVTPVNAAFNSPEEINSWVTYYYITPEPSKIPDAIEYMSQVGWLDDKNSIAPIFGFLAGGFTANPKQVSGWVDRLSSLNESHLGVVILGLWYSSLPDSQQRTYEFLDKHPNLKQEYSYLYKGSPMAIEEIPLEQGTWVLDVLWGNFSATGSKTPIIRIMSTLPWVDIKGDINRLMIGGAAQWSLTSNAVQHQRILGFCETEVSAQPQDVADKLRHIIESAKKELKGEHNKSLNADASEAGAS